MRAKFEFSLSKLERECVNSLKVIKIRHWN